ncbi:30S ribosomal protein S8e [Candidatus Woesearchaeota archaeon]|nr:30S ribosomal protein S8e [Candidatus Woesearchaeota archaeon]
MARSQRKSRRKSSGGLYHYSRGKRKRELAGFNALTKLGEKKELRSKRVLGGHKKDLLLAVKEINVADKKGKTIKTEIISVLENTANPNLVRRSVLTKGTIVETKLGKVRITSRPGQEGLINGELL